MSTVVNARSNLATDPIRNFRFLVTFHPHEADALDVDFKPSIGFTSVSGLSVTTESIPYREGGYNTSVHQIPGQTQFSPVTLQRGVMLGTRQHWDWMRRLYRVTNNPGSSGLNMHNFRSDIEIRVLGHPTAGTASTIGGGAGGQSITGGEAMANAASENDNVVMRFKVYNAWPTSLAFSDLNAGDNALMVEQMTLVHEGFDVNYATSYSNRDSAPSFSFN